MIRDEFKKQQESKTITSKEMIKIRKLGERGFYSSRISNLSSTIAIVTFSTWFSFIAVILTVALITITKIAGGDLVGGFFVFIIIFCGIVTIWSLFWFIFYRNYLKRKIERYRNNIKELNESVSKKQTEIFKNYLKKEN